ncbi:alginate export family protein [Alteromonas sp.]|uniref:alginate export family protein n=1 Tax=Alteromonas sp. TaxID=232 RepID=UPI00257F9E11|nr:alginate export family protein [Alteromonas sp.]
MALAPIAQGADWYEALSDIKASADFYLRYEGASQDNALSDANALTLRTFAGIESGEYNGFSFKVEMEDSRIVLGQGDYTVGPTGYNVGEYSVIADPETTELDQAYIQYRSDNIKVKAGRQVIALDTHRFIGSVAWRQDRQTFDGISVNYKVSDNIHAFYAYVNQRNRIFAEAADFDSKDHFLNVSYSNNIGKLTAYAYLLEIDNDTDNALDTYGIRYAGSYSTDSAKWLYTAEVAKQSSENATNDFDANYLLLEAGAVVSGVTAKLGYEVLGSDDGNYGFATPLATLHKFNGWSDQFLGTPAQGLKDLSATISAKFAGGKWTAIYHQFDADEASLAIDDLGSEINLLYTTKVAERFNLGVKYANYSADDFSVDTDRVWVWVSTKF